MRKLGKPNISHAQLYAQAIEQTQAKADRDTLKALTEKVVQAGQDYDSAMAGKGPYAVKAVAFTEQQEPLVSSLYAYRLSAKSGACRATYDEIWSSSAYCPYCEAGEVYEVDHFLPQSVFPCLNIYPANLIPICHPCNHIKLAKPPIGPRESFVHPYFDVLPKVPWLFAKIALDAGGPVLRYWVDLDAAAHGDLAYRLQYHFKTLELDRRMCERSAKVLIELQADLDELLPRGGTAAVQAHFGHAAEKEFTRHGNTLEAAAYRAAAENDDFCAGNYIS